MKLAGRDVARFVAAPDRAAAGMLLHGSDPGRVAARRAALVAALIGPDGPAEMRLARIAAADLRRDPALLADAVKATGFFPGPRAVLVEDAGEGVGPAILAALADWRPGDATIVVSAGTLSAGSALRRGFETARGAYAIPVYADPPGRAEIEAALAAAGLPDLDREAMAALEALAASLDAGEFAMLVERLAIYRAGEPGPATAADVAAVAPAEPEAEADAVLDLALQGRADALVRALRRSGGGADGPGLLGAAGRRLRMLHAASCDPGGPEAAFARARPAVFGARKDRLVAQVRAMPRDKLESAMALVLEAELSLRSSSPPPAGALAERLLVRIAMLARG